MLRNWSYPMTRFLFLLFLLVPLGVQAIPPLPDEVIGKSPELRPVGEGRLRWLGLHIYDAALWTGESAVSMQDEFALDIRYARNIPARRLVGTSVKEMRRLGFGDSEQREQWSREMARVFPDIAKGDRLTGVNRPGVGAEFYHNGRFVGGVNDPGFSDAFFSIWLDPRTREPGLRESLIGRN
jgi:hypothetical protein